MVFTLASAIKVSKWIQSTNDEDYRQMDLAAVMRHPLIRDQVLDVTTPNDPGDSIVTTPNDPGDLIGGGPDGWFRGQPRTRSVQASSVNIMMPDWLTRLLKNESFILLAPNDNLARTLLENSQTIHDWTYKIPLYQAGINWTQHIEMTSKPDPISIVTIALLHLDQLENARSWTSAFIPLWKIVKAQDNTEQHEISSKRCTDMGDMCNHVLRFHSNMHDVTLPDQPGKLSQQALDFLQGLNSNWEDL